MPTVDIPLIPALALTLQFAGVTRERAKAILTEAMHDAFFIDEKKASDCIKERIDDVKGAIGHAQDILGNLPKKTRKGKMNVKGEVEIGFVEVDVEKAEAA